MKLDLESLKNKKAWQSIGVETPTFDIEKLRQNTYDNPQWVHFGGGNIFRVFVASALQDAIEKGKTDTGVIVTDSFDLGVISNYYNVFDNLSLSVIMKANGDFDKSVVASMTEALKCSAGYEDFDRLKEIFRNKELKMISFTITEKGYALKDISGKYFGVVKSDIKNGPEQAKHTMSIVASLLYERFKSGAHPLAVVSMDNCSKNGERLGAAVKEIAEKWLENGFVEKDFVDYIHDGNKISFPLTMIDKITPRPAANVQKSLELLGIEDMGLIQTDKGSYIAPFVNSEECEYLIIEDDFPNGKIDISSDHVIFTDKDTVNNVETMKVTTCLNPLHTALAVTGCLLGYTSIADEMQDETLVKLINRIGYDEGLKVVVDPKIINPKEFIDEVVFERFVNPNIPDTPQRIAMDTSQKVGIRFGETIKAYHKNETLSVSDLVGIPLAIAAWCRYLVGINDSGETFEISSDPMKEQLVKYFEGAELGGKDIDISGILSSKAVFGIDLFDVGLGQKIQKYFDEMMKGTDAVSNTLQRYLKE